MIVLDFTLFEMVHVYVYSICARAPKSVVKLRFEVQRSSLETTFSQHSRCHRHGKSLASR